MTIKIDEKEYTREEILEQFSDKMKKDVPFAFLTDTSVKAHLKANETLKFAVGFAILQLIINIAAICGIQALKSEIISLQNKTQQLQQQVDQHNTIDDIKDEVDNIWDYTINLQETLEEWDVQSNKPVLKQENTEKTSEV